MNKTAETELHRLYLIEGLPEPLTPTSSHLQIFDNYIENSRLRLRKIRDPYAKTWTHVLQQRFPFFDGEYAVTKSAEIHLNAEEYALFEGFEGREIRKNRYFHEFDRLQFVFDVYLGPLWGLNTLRIDFDTIDELKSFVPPPFAIFEVTQDAFFSGDNLVDKIFEDVQVEIGRLIPLDQEQIRR